MENIKTVTLKNSEEGSHFVAQKIKKLIEDNNVAGKSTVLGLATGSTPVPLYRQLVKMHKNGLDFSRVKTFNLDEYYPIEPDAMQSYHRFMKENLFDHVNILPEHIRIPDGTIPVHAIEEYCRKYEQDIQDAGGIDIQILGIGRTGHIGFNEPGSSNTSLTRLVTLDKKTRIDAAGDFRNEENVPRTAITMGVGTIFKAREICLMAWGENKAEIVSKAVEGAVTYKIPATFLQEHPNTTFVLDELASSNLLRIKTPWLAGDCDWDEAMILKATCWLSQKLKKPVLKLTDEDYNNYNLSELVATKGSSYELNLDIFRRLRDTITGWPGGKPGTQDERRPERAEPFPKKSLVLSPHPDDEVNAMGGTLIRLVDQGHEVHVAYQTSGSVGVVDDDVVNQLNFVKEVADYFKVGDGGFDHYLDEIKTFFLKKNASTEDSESVKEIKGLIRKVEARASCRYCGVSKNSVHFLDMPFYQTGKKQKKAISDEDVQMIVDLLRKIKPHQVFMGVDQSDPNGTYQLTYDATLLAFQEVKEESWFKDCWVWMYRCNDKEWSVAEVDMAVPLSPEESMRKRQSIVKHKSQIEKVFFPGEETKEAWQRSEERNRGMAKIYDQLGLPDYEGIEVFRRLMV